MRWLRTIWRALRIEPEVWAVYLAGQQSKEMPHVIEAKPRFSGLPLRIAAFGWGLLKALRPPRKSDLPSAVDLLVFAQSENQANALSSTVKHLRQYRVSVFPVTTGGAAITSRELNAEKTEWINLSISDALKVVVLAFIRAPVIIWNLRGKDARLRKWHIDAFFRCHIYLVFFDKLISSVQPRIILVSNDHNAPHRCLLALARVKGIETAYMQHASVSKRFPRLVFNYSLLDGAVAAAIYSACEGNGPAASLLPSQRHILLTGQKKWIKKHDVGSSRTVGVAINALDQAEDTERVVNELIESEYSVRLRWHPGMSRARTEEITAMLSGASSLTFSDPSVESVSEFLGRIAVLVAGNSSIHLEAAIAGVVPVYYEMSPVSAPDYYGYVKNGISLEAWDIDQLGSKIGEILIYSAEPDRRAVQAYSATFGTEWEGREGELAADILEHVLAGADPAQCWGYLGVVDQDVASAAQR